VLPKVHLLTKTADVKKRAISTKENNVSINNCEEAAAKKSPETNI
jgi:hypothetical protein